MDVINTECPFCGSCIRAFHKPSASREQKKASWGGSKKSYKREAEIFEAIEDCSNCGKSKEEINKALKHGKESSNEEVIRRLREAGLDPTKLK